MGLSYCFELESSLEYLVLLDTFSALLGLATRKRVYVLPEGHLFVRHILVQLMANVLLNRSFVRPYRIHIVSATPKVSIPIPVLHLCMAVKYHQGAFPFQVSHKLGHAQVRGDAHQHVNVVGACFRF